MDTINEAKPTAGLGPGREAPTEFFEEAIIDADGSIIVPSDGECKGGWTSPTDGQVWTTIRC